MPITYQKLGAGEGLIDLVITTSSDSNVDLKLGNTVLDQGWTSKDGVVIFKNLKPGTYTVVVNNEAGLNSKAITISNQYKETIFPIEKVSCTHNVNPYTGSVYLKETYGNNLSKNDVVTIPGAKRLEIEVWCGTESISYDWLAIYPPGVTPSRSNYNKASISGGKIGGNPTTINEVFGPDKPSSSKKFTVLGDTAQLYFTSDSSNGNYGYYAVITGYDS